MEKDTHASQGSWQRIRSVIKLLITSIFTLMGSLGSMIVVALLIPPVSVLEKATTLVAGMERAILLLFGKESLAGVKQKSRRPWYKKLGLSLQINENLQETLTNMAESESSPGASKTLNTGSPSSSRSQWNTENEISSEGKNEITKLERQLGNNAGDSAEEWQVLDIANSKNPQRDEGYRGGDHGANSGARPGAQGPAIGSIN